MISTRESEDSIKEKQRVREAIYGALADGKSFSLWRTPGTHETHLIICEEPNEVTEFNLEEGSPGFAFASFVTEGKKYLFPAEVYYQFENKIQTKGPDIESFHAHEPDLLQKVTFHKKSEGGVKRNENFNWLVESGLNEIAAGRLEKIVPSRFKDIYINKSVDLLYLFDVLCEKHAQAFVSLVSSPQTGTWLGATPELLVSVDDKNIFSTISLAGTQPYLPETDLKSVAWKEKEIEEQALVSRYIINCFKKIRLREYEEHGPRTTIAGNIMHLKTVYQVDMKATNFPQLGTVMLKLLHPTSAVCGMPFEIAYDFLKKNEGYDREFYSGYLGTVQINNQSQIFVNLRCMQVFENSVRLYAGAGVTVYSNPEKEFEETEMKMQNIQNLIIT